MDNLVFKIGNRKVGQGEHCLIIGEVAQAHEGSLGAAHAFVDAIADAGADAVKFQTHIAAAESSPKEVFRVKFSKQDKTRFDYWKRMEFSAEEWKGLAEHTHRRKLIFLSSPFSTEAVDLLEKMDIPAWKIASGEASNPFLLNRIYQTKKPILLSTGLISESELDDLTAEIKKQEIALLIMQCTTAYPAPAEKLGLNLIAKYREKYHVPTGLSDHSGKMYASLAAVALGANAVEVHVTLSKKMFGPDVAASITPKELSRMVEGVKFVETALGHPIQEKILDKNAIELKKMFGKSLVAAKNIPAGKIVENADLTARKPGSGIPAIQISVVLGKKVKRAILAGDFLKNTDLE